MKVSIKEQFRQFVLSETTFTRPSQRKANTKGALKNDKHIVQSTMLSPSLWEYVDSDDPDTNASQSKLKVSTKKSVHKSNMSPNPNTPSVKVHIPQKNKITSIMHEYIKKVVDVAGDDHCGSCAVRVYVICLLMIIRLFVINFKKS